MFDTALGGQGFRGALVGEKYSEGGAAQVLQLYSLIRRDGGLFGSVVVPVAVVVVVGIFHRRGSRGGVGITISVVVVVAIGRLVAGQQFIRIPRRRKIAVGSAAAAVIIVASGRGRRLGLLLLLLLFLFGHLIEFGSIGIHGGQFDFQVCHFLLDAGGFVHHFVTSQ